MIRLKIDHGLQIKALNDHRLKERIIQQSKDNSFSRLLQERLENKEVKFSKHAMERAEQRGIAIENKLRDDIGEAIDKARMKGIKDIVVIGKQGAFVVNVTNSTVVTSMDPMEMKNNIFTNIDGAVII
ncbi:MAG: TIGR02530 family flagellar biosynthesis protein [Peptostreptococcaceae bacterium]|nr:TIGR02530 family flagellar biosynthesis protein [Peptostreptococcaceae bacterium]